jgi:hypothetical protein
MGQESGWRQVADVQARRGAQSLVFGHYRGLAVDRHDLLTEAPLGNRSVQLHYGRWRELRDRIVKGRDAPPFGS